MQSFSGTLTSFVSKKKGVIVFKLISLGTIGGQTVYNNYAFSCPCSPSRNYLYGLTVIGVPALVLFLLGVTINQRTWDILSECYLRRCQKVTGMVGLALLASVLGWATVAPITWSVLSLLRGKVYVCAFSEFVSIKNFSNNSSDVQGIMAGFPCGQVPEELLEFWTVTEKRLKYESQMVGLVILGFVSLLAFLVVCLKRCCSPLGYHQEAYWSHFRSLENKVFQRTMDAHAHIQAIRHVRSYFGFVALDDEEKELLESAVDAKASIPSLEWNRITGVNLYRENEGVPLYSRLHKWFNCNMQAMEKVS